METKRTTNCRTCYNDNIDDIDADIQDDIDDDDIDRC